MTRYDPHYHYGAMEPHEFGDWVSVDDVIKLLDAISGQAYDAGVYGEDEANERLKAVRRMADAALADMRSGS